MGWDTQRGYRHHALNLTTDMPAPMLGNMTSYLVSQNSPEQLTPRDKS